MRIVWFLLFILGATTQTTAQPFGEVSADARALPTGCLLSPYPSTPIGETGEQLIDYGSSGAFYATVWREVCRNDVLKSALMMRITVTRGTPYICNSSMTLEQDGRAYYASGFKSESGLSMCGSFTLNTTRVFALDQSSYYGAAFDDQRGFLIRDRTFAIVAPGYWPVLRDISVTLATIGTGGGRIIGSHGQLDCRSGSTAGCAATVKEASILVLTATPDAESRFAGWVEPGCGTTNAVASIRLNNALTCTARFDSAKAGVAIGFTGNGSGRVINADGRLNCGPSSSAGCSVSVVAPTSMTLTAIPDFGSRFAGWVEVGCGTAVTTTIQIAIGAAVTCTAKFDQVAANPETGFWYDPARSGIGFGIERLGDRMMLSAFMYRGDGTPFWFIASGTYSVNRLAAKVEQFFGGPPLGADIGPGLSLIPGGNIVVVFSGSNKATITWDGLDLPIALVRYKFADMVPAADPAPVDDVRPAARNPALENLAVALSTQRVIVTLKEGGDTRRRAMTLQGRMARAGASRVEVLATVPQIIVDAGPAALAALRDDPEVASISFDRPMYPSLRESGPLVQADVMRNAGVTGVGKAIAVIDTGVDASHPFLGGRVVAEACFGTSIVAPDAKAVPACPNRQTSQFGPGSARPCSAVNCEHGTHVAGIAAGSAPGIYGVAPNAPIVAVLAVTHIEGEGCPAGKCWLFLFSDVLRALDWVNQQVETLGIAAVNLSLGGGHTNSYCDTSPLKPAIDALRAKGVATVVATGNEGWGSQVAEPACISSVIAVGASTKSDDEWLWSNAWFNPMLMAPGAGIVSSVPGGGYAAFSGTSMAAPHVAGAFALLKGIFPNASVSDIQRELTSTAAQVSVYKYDRIKIRDAAIVLNAPYRILPESGWWWTPGANGRGFFIETQSDQIYMASYHYGHNGPSDWAVGQGQIGFGGQIPFALRRFVGGTSVDGAAKAPAETTGMGSVILRFTNSRTGEIILPDGRRQPLLRFGV